TAGADAAVARAPRRPMREYVAWALAATFALVSGALAVRSISPARPDPAGLVRFAMPSPDESTFAAGIGSAPFALSPDGRRLAFVASGPNGRQVWVRSFDSLDARPLAGTD